MMSIGIFFGSTKNGTLQGVPRTRSSLDQSYRDHLHNKKQKKERKQDRNRHTRILYSLRIERKHIVCHKREEELIL